MAYSGSGKENDNDDVYSDGYGFLSSHSGYTYSDYNVYGSYLGYYSERLLSDEKDNDSSKEENNAENSDSGSGK